MELTNKQAGKKLREARTRLCLSQEALAKRLGVSRVSIEAYEAGHRYPPDEVAMFAGIPCTGKHYTPLEARRVKTQLPDIKPGMRAIVQPVSFGAREERKGGGVTTLRVPMPCTCESINEQGIVTLLFKVRGGTIRECFKITDPALNVRWER